MIERLITVRNYQLTESRETLITSEIDGGGVSVKSPDSEPQLKRRPPCSTDSTDSIKTNPMMAKVSIVSVPRPCRPRQ